MWDMMWSYRAIKNPVARKKWLSLVFILVAIGFVYSVYRILLGENVIKVLLIFALFSLFIFLYAIISLGKPRFYLMDEEMIIYKPFKTKLSEVEGFEIEEENLRIRLKKRGFGVKTLYFEKLEDLRNAERWLRRKLSQ